MWNIPFAAFNDVNLANVSRITIGFGDGNDPEPNLGAGIVYFDDIILGCGSFEEPLNQGPVYLDEDPFVYGEGQFFLKQDCPLIGAGFGYIDEHSHLIGKTTDINGFPDSDIIDIGFHYPNWNYVNAGDGNTLNADLNQDGVVNFGDFALIAGGWGTTYDINDLNTMAEEWLRAASIHPLITVTISGEPNNLTGDVSIGVSGYGITTERAFVLMDGEYIDELEYFDSNTPLTLDTCTYRNGNHSIKIVATGVNKLVTVSGTLEADFNNAFHSIIASDYFYPTNDYNASGFHDGNSSFEAKLADYNDQVLWSNTYSGPSVNIVIPGAAFGDAQLCKLSMTETSSGKGREDRIYKAFVKEDFIGVKMVLLLPNPDIADAKSSLIDTIMDSCKKKKVPYREVYYQENTPENWTYIFKTLDDRKDIYYGGHSNSHVGGVQRTHLECWKDGQKIKAFSYTTKYEPDAQPLPDNWDEKGFDLRELGLKDDDRIRIGWFDGCRTAGHEIKGSGDIIFKRCHEDLARTFGFFSVAAQENNRSIFFGWRMDPKSYPGLTNCFSFANSGQEIIWGEEGLGWGTPGGEEDRTIQQALDATEDSPHTNIHIKHALWGKDKVRDCEPDGDDNLFSYGFGMLWNMKLEW